MMKDLSTPLDRVVIRDLRIGDLVTISGTVVTMRDQAYLRALDEGAPVDLGSSAVYHCGPLAKMTDDGWVVFAAGPTTSARMGSNEPGFIRRFKPCAIIGKGGEGRDALEAMEEVGCVYLATTGGAAIIAAKAVAEVLDVHWLELGIPEAVWSFRMESFGPLVVAMDSRLGNLYDNIRKGVMSRVPEIERMLGISP